MRKKRPIDMTTKIVPIAKGAEFSADGKHRNSLHRVWQPSKPMALCIGLNPSNADADDDDPTIRILMQTLNRLGFGGFFMMNLFTLISSNPKVLSSYPNAVGEADEYIAKAMEGCDTIIFCWGNFKQGEWRAKKLIPKFPGAKCFGHTKNGSPVHPMALMYSGTTKTAQLIDFKK